MIWLISILPSLAVVGTLTAWEFLHRPARTDWWRNLQAWFFYGLAGFAFLPLYTAFHFPSLADGANLPLWLGCLAFLVVRDGLEFLYHRAQHSVPLLWSMHSLHHSDPEMSALTTQRHYWADQLVKAVTVWPATFMVIAPTPEILAIYAGLSLWHFLVHARLPIGFGRFSWVLNAPAYHRRHHSRLPEHYNSNFAALFPLFDVVCGTYHRPDGFPPTGLDRAPASMLDVLAWPIRQGNAEAQSAPAKAP